MFERVDFYAHVEQKLTVDCVQVENSSTFATVVAPRKQKMDTKLQPKRTVPFKTFLVPVPFPLVTTFETSTYKKWLWPNSTYITYTWHALLLWHTYLHTYIYIYIYRTSSNLYTPDSVSLASLARQLWHIYLHTHIYIYIYTSHVLL